MSATPDDPYLWLEEVDRRRRAGVGPRRNEETTAELAAGGPFAEVHGADPAGARRRRPDPVLRWRGDHLYNFWQDAAHPRGLWRRTTLE